MRLFVAECKAAFPRKFVEGDGYERSFFQIYVRALDENRAKALFDDWMKTALEIEMLDWQDRGEILPGSLMASDDEYATTAFMLSIECGLLETSKK